MARLPSVGGDDGNWGTILNQFLQVSHNTDGTIQSGAVNGTTGWLNVKTQYGAKGDGVTDDTTAIQNALNAAATQGGGVVYLPAATYLVSNLLIDTNVTLIGDGVATLLTPGSGTTGYMIALAHPASTKQIVISNISLKPNTGSLGGIQLDNTGYGGSSDPQHKLDNVVVLQAGGDAFHFDNNARGMKITRCTQYGAGGYGYLLGNGLASSGAGCTDSTFSDCVSGPSGNHGFYVIGWNNMFSGCKAFYSGYSGGSFNTTGCCFEIANTQYNTFVNCSAQDGALHGFDLQSNAYVSVVGCEADTNGSGQPSGSAGINLNSNTYCVISGNTTSNSQYASGNLQQYGMQVAGTQTKTFIIGNTLNGTSGAFNYVSGGGYIYFGTDTIDMTGVPQVKVPSLAYSADSLQTLANSGTINVSSDGNYGVVPVTASTNVTGIILQTPSNSWSQITIVNQSAFTVTFATSGTSHVADGTSDVIPTLAARTFIYDSNSSLWYRAG